MSIQKQWTLPLAVLLTLTVGAAAAQAQLSAGRSSLGAPPVGYPMAAPPGMGPMAGPGYPAVAPVVAVDPATGAYYAPPGVLPIVAGPDPTVGGATPPVAEPMMMTGDDGFYGDEEMTDEEYHARHERLGLLAALLPYDEGGICAPRWWDVYADAIRFRRENVSRKVDFSSNGPLAVGGIALSSDNLDFQEAYGFRAGMATQLSAGSNIEFNFLGALNFADRAEATSNTNNLFHIFSDYGANPFLGFPQTDAAFFHDIAYSSSLNSFEMSFRRRWQGRNCRVQGSWLGGIRYVSMNEDFVHRTRATFQNQPQFMDYTTSTINSLTGFQIGGDAWVSLLPGLRFGGELKTGLYGNYTHQNTSILASTLTGGAPFSDFERTNRNGAAFVGELSLGLTYRVNYHWTFRAGYDFLYLDGVALAIENFNNNPPNFNDPQSNQNQRPLFFNNNGDVFLHGATLGLEYIW